VSVTSKHWGPLGLYLSLRVAPDLLYTDDIPGFADRLLAVVPALADTVCQNDAGLCFAEELRATELGHALEHVVLALLTERSIFGSGETRWNWRRHPRGVFQLRFWPDQRRPLPIAEVEWAVARAIDIVSAVLAECTAAASVTQPETKTA